MRIVRYLAIALLLFGCGRKKLDTQGYITWMSNKENGLMIEKKVNNFVFNLYYKPVQYEALQNLAGQPVNEETYRKSLDDFRGMEYYTLRIGSADHQTDILKNGISSDAEYYGRIQYYSSSAQNDLKLVAGKDTFPCSIYHFERTYKMSSFNNLILAFQTRDSTDLPELKEDRKLVYNDKVLGVGKVEITISKEAINKIPQLSL